MSFHQVVPEISSLFKQRLWGLAAIQRSLVFNLIRGLKVVQEVFTETLTGPEHNNAAPPPTHPTHVPHTEGNAESDVDSRWV